MRSPVVIFFLALLSLFVLVKEISAQVYKYVDKDGGVHFTDTPTDPKYKSYVDTTRRGELKTSFSGCEVISFSQYEIIEDIYGSGGGFGGSSHFSVNASKETCVDISIRNGDRVEKTLRGDNIMASTKDGERKKAKGVSVRIAPRKTFRGNICFGRDLGVIERVDLVDESEKETLRKPTPPPPPKPKSENKSYGGVNTIGSSKKSVIRKDRSGRF